MAIASLPCLIVVPPSKNRTVLIKSPKSTAMALNKPNDLVKVDSSIIFILQGEKRDWKKSSDSPKTSQWKFMIQKKLLTPNSMLSSRSIISQYFCYLYGTRTNFCTKSTSSAKSTHAAKYLVQSDILGCFKECWGMQCSVVDMPFRK